MIGKLFLNLGKNADAVQLVAMQHLSCALPMPFQETLFLWKEAGRFGPAPIHANFRPQSSS